MDGRTRLEQMEIEEAGKPRVRPTARAVIQLLCIILFWILVVIGFLISFAFILAYLSTPSEDRLAVRDIDDRSPLAVEGTGKHGRHHNVYLEGLAAYDLSHLDDNLNVSVNASGWFVIPSTSGTWPTALQTTRQGHAAFSRLRKCGSLLISMNDQQLDREPTMVSRIALLECRNVIEQHLSATISQQPSEHLFEPHRLDGDPPNDQKDTVDANSSDASAWLDTRRCEKHYCDDFKQKPRLCDTERLRMMRKVIPRMCIWCDGKTDAEKARFAEKIKQQCRKTMLREQRAFYFLSGIAVFALGCAILGVFVKNVRRRRKLLKQELKERERIDKWLRDQARSRAYSSPTSKRVAVVAPDVEAGTDGSQTQKRWYHIFRRQRKQRTGSEGHTMVTEDNAVDGGGPNAIGLVPVMPHAANAKGRSTSLDIETTPPPGLHSRTGSSDVERHKSDPVRGKYASFQQQMPTTSHVLKHGLHGRLCSSDNAGGADHDNVARSKV